MKNTELGLTSLEYLLELDTELVDSTYSNKTHMLTYSLLLLSLELMISFLFIPEELRNLLYMKSSLRESSANAT